MQISIGIKNAINYAISNTFSDVAFESYREQRALMVAHCMSGGGAVCDNIDELQQVIDCHWNEYRKNIGGKYNESVCGVTGKYAGLSIFIRKIHFINSNLEKMLKLLKDDVTKQEKR